MVKITKPKYKVLFKLLGKKKFTEKRISKVASMSSVAAKRFAAKVAIRAPTGTIVKVVRI